MFYRNRVEHKFYVILLNGIHQKLYGCAVANSINEIKANSYNHRFIYNTEHKNICNIYTVSTIIDTKTFKMQTFYINVPTDSLSDDYFIKLN